MADYNTLKEAILDLMDRYEWMPASIARYVLEHHIDIEDYI